MKKIIALLSVLVSSIFIGLAFGSYFDINPLVPGAVSFIASYVTPVIIPKGVFASLVFTTPAAAGTYQFNLNYIPEFLIYDAGAAPLTSLKVDEANMGNILDLPLAGIADVRAFGRFGLTASTVTKFRLATGNMPNKNVTVTIVQPGAVAIGFYASSDNDGDNENPPAAFKYTTLALLAGQPTQFKNFSALFLSNLAATDTVLVKFNSGYSQLFNRTELLELTSLYQNNQLATGFILNNVNAYIESAIVTQAAAGAAYMMKVLVPGQAII
jgi:hypothetical protein